VVSHTQFNANANEFDLKTNKLFVEFYGETGLPIAYLSSDAFMNCEATRQTAFSNQMTEFGLNGALRVNFQFDSVDEFHAAYIDYPVAKTRLYIRRAHHGFNFGIQTTDLSDAVGLCVSGARSFDKKQFEWLISSNLPLARQTCDSVFATFRLFDNQFKSELIRACVEDVAASQHAHLAFDYRNSFVDQLFFMYADFSQFIADIKSSLAFGSVSKNSLSNAFPQQNSFSAATFLQQKGCVNVEREQSILLPAGSSISFRQNQAATSDNDNDEHEDDDESEGKKSGFGVSKLKTKSENDETQEDEKQQDVDGKRKPGNEKTTEFARLCRMKLSEATDEKVFFLQHPNSPRMYIQCDEFGRAFIKQCLNNTVFVTASRACEKSQHSGEEIGAPRSIFGNPTINEQQQLEQKQSQQEAELREAEQRINAEASKMRQEVTAQEFKSRQKAAKSETRQEITAEMFKNRKQAKIQELTAEEFMNRKKEKELKIQVAAQEFQNPSSGIKSIEDEIPREVSSETFNDIKQSKQAKIQVTAEEFMNRKKEPKIQVASQEFQNPSSEVQSNENESRQEVSAEMFKNRKQTKIQELTTEEFVNRKNEPKIQVAAQEFQNPSSEIKSKENESDQEVSTETFKDRKQAKTQVTAEEFMNKKKESKIQVAAQEFQNPSSDNESLKMRQEVIAQESTRPQKADKNESQNNEKEINPPRSKNLSNTMMISEKQQQERKSVQQETELREAEQRVNTESSKMRQEVTAKELKSRQKQANSENQNNEKEIDRKAMTSEKQQLEQKQVQQETEHREAEQRVSDESKMRQEVTSQEFKRRQKTE
jgi:hypothetical protein